MYEIGTSGSLHTEDTKALLRIDLERFKEEIKDYLGNSMMDVEN